VDYHNLDMGQFPSLSGAVDASAKTGEVAFGMLLDLRPSGDGSNDKKAGFDLILQSG